MTTVALVDDHILLRNSLAKIISKFDGYKVLFESDNGLDFIKSVEKDNAPDIVLLDISMPQMNGYETAEWIKNNLPDTKILVLSMMDNDASVIRMINLGAKGYILKDSKPLILKEAFDNIVRKGFYSNDLVSGSMMSFVNSGLQPGVPAVQRFKFSDNEILFIKYACTEMTYKEIATEMNTTLRNIDHFRDTVFEKLKLKSRIGLVLFAVKEGFVIV